MNVYPAFRFPFAVALAIAIAGAARQPQARLIVAETAVILVFSAAWQFLAVYAVEGVYNPLKRRAAAVTCVMVGAVCYGRRGAHRCDDMGGHGRAQQGRDR